MKLHNLHLQYVKPRFRSEFYQQGMNLLAGQEQVVCNDTRDHLHLITTVSLGAEKIPGYRCHRGVAN